MYVYSRELFSAERPRSFPRFFTQRSSHSNPAARCGNSHVHETSCFLRRFPRPRAVSARRFFRGRFPPAALRASYFARCASRGYIPVRFRRHVGRSVRIIHRARRGRLHVAIYGNRT